MHQSKLKRNAVGKLRRRRITNARIHGEQRALSQAENSRVGCHEEIRVPNYKAKLGGTLHGLVGEESCDGDTVQTGQSRGKIY